MNTLKSFVFAIGAAGLLPGCAANTTPAPAPEPGPPMTSAAPFAASAAVHHPLGTKGMKSLQQALIDKGHPLKVDGRPGPKTTAALMQYQKDMGIVPANGQLDDQTWSALGLSEGN
jgi:peptidoglycan hydrolase-like protein with peptidoglycan-binding domain